MSLASMIVQALSQLRDVTLTAPTNGQALVYNSSTGKWVNGSAGSTSPLTTKGDIWGYSTVDARRPVGTDGYALVADSTQATGLNYQAIGTAQPNTKVQLNYTASTDIISGLAISAATWTDLIANQNFTVDDASSVIEISLTGMILGNSTSVDNDWGIRINIDSAGTPITPRCGGGRGNVASAYQNILMGTGTISITGLAVGVHTIKPQVYGVNAMTAHCGVATSPNTYALSLRVLERKQSTAPSPPTVWSTKTTNYTILTTDRAILVDTSGGAVTITVPTAVSATQLYTIKKKTSDANAVTVATTSAQTIDGSATQTLTTQNQSIDIASDNTNWYVL